jgi:antitoxin component YwqK of YwqJK toxin-antitoxin module
MEVVVKLKKKATARSFTQFHKDGSIWAKGKTIDDTPTGYWEWFRVDGTKLRSGFFTDGKQTGLWITYDRKGKTYKTTDMDKKKMVKKSSPACGK